MSSQHSQEVQLLLTAEKRASEKVAEARKMKTKRLKQAKEEAAADIELFKAERHKAFEEYERLHIGSKGDVAKRIETETTEKINEMASRINSTKQQILDRLISEVVTNVDPKLHRNHRKPISL